MSDNIAKNADVRASRLEEIRARVAAATPGPWEHHAGTVWSGIHFEHDADLCFDASLGDAEFAAHAREDVPWLLAELDGWEQWADRVLDGYTEAATAADSRRERLIRRYAELRAERARAEAAEREAAQLRAAAKDFLRSEYPNGTDHPADAAAARLARSLADVGGSLPDPDTQQQTGEEAQSAETAGTRGVGLIAAERQRQMAFEGWTPEHDAGHEGGELALAAVCYALPERERSELPPIWPWERRWWKPTPRDRVRELAKAGALIAAEIDRLTAPSPAVGGDTPAEPCRWCGGHGWVSPPETWRDGEDNRVVCPDCRGTGAGETP